ncbi:MAG TPA: hypothetical protein VLK65_05770 [Vicinamibacteria bacterium]|nr:hypothetical protein [Vicinamibacteria bacterium]
MKVYLGLVWLLGAGVAYADTHRFSFDEDAAGKAPGAFTTARTGQGAQGTWVVEAVADAPSAPNAVKQTSTDDTSYRFPVMVAAGVRATNGTLSVRFKAVSGRVDQAAGLVWRYADENNYYIVRANALEDNVVLYKVEKGKRSSLAPRGTRAGTYGVDHEVPGGEWNTLTVHFEGPVFTVSFNDSRLFEVEDRTFENAGGVGIWTKADSVTLFDDLLLESQ